MVQELGENRSAEIHSPFSHLRSSPSGRPFLAYLSSNRKNLKSPLIHSLSIDWEDSRCRLPDGTDLILSSQGTGEDIDLKLPELKYPFGFH